MAGWGMRVRRGGQALLDTSDRVFTLLGTKSYNVTPFYFADSFTDVNLSRGQPMAVITSFPADPSFGTTLRTQLTFSGNTCSWFVQQLDYSPGFQGPLVFHYGYF